MKIAKNTKLARKPSKRKNDKPMMSPEFFRVMDEMLERQRLERRKLKLPSAAPNDERRAG